MHTSSHVGQIKSEFLLPSFLEASKALTHSPPQTLGYERSKSSFTANSRTLMAAIKSAGDFCVSRSTIRHLPTFQLLPLFLLQKLTERHEERSSPGPQLGYEWLWNVLKMRKSTVQLGVSFICLATPPQIWEMPPNNFEFWRCLLYFLATFLHTDDILSSTQNNMWEWS